MESIGGRLKSARERKKLSLEKVNKDTKIHAKLLNAMESDSIDEQMSPVYARNFLKTYAQYLGLNARELVDEFTEAHPVTSEPALNIEKVEKTVQHSPIMYEKAMPRPGKKAPPFPFFVFIAGLFVIAAMIFVGVRVVMLASSHLKSNAAKSPQKQAVLKSKKEALAPKAAAGAQKKISVPRNQQLVLRVKAKSDVWLKIKSDGKVIFQDILGAGASEEWRANDRFSVSTGKAENTSLFLNGNPLEPLRGGVRKDVIITREGLETKN